MSYNKPTHPFRELSIILKQSFAQVSEYVEKVKYRNTLFGISDVANISTFQGVKEKPNFQTDYRIDSMFNVMFFQSNRISALFLTTHTNQKRSYNLSSGEVHF